jgi:two-component system, chemotaxis family, sensor kinase CheA
MDEMDLSQFKEVFVSESKEHLVALNAALIELEKKPSNKEVLNDIFRVAHTLKGMSATMGYDKMTRLAHQMEDVLDSLRKGEAQARGNIVDVIFECFDKLENLIEEIESGVESKIDIDGLVARLSGLVLKEEHKAEEIRAPAPEAPDGKDKAAEIPEEETRSAEDIESAAGSAGKKSKTSIRINISHLDKMMNLVGEMVISKSQLEQIAVIHQIEELKETLQQLDRIAVELQEAVLKTRMVPLSQIFDRYPRMARDLSLKLGKEIDFDIYGSDIEIDRMLIEEINEPLVHLLRNALDHGIEAPDKRVEAGKPRKGKVVLSARRERGYTSINVTDDGKGLDPVLIKQKAVEKGIITDEEAKSTNEEETYRLICDPRFSTAEIITDVSGRGVGMDVVKNAIESFSGRLIINSTHRVGSSFTVNLPLSIAIISSLIIKINDEIYAIPLNNITEVVPFTQSEVRSIEKREVIVLRDEVLPLVWLEKLLGVNNNSSSDKQSANRYILRVEIGAKSVGLVVDNFIGRKEIVIKSLSGIIKRAKGFSGATILGDGSVVLILDINSLF